MNGIKFKVEFNNRQFGISIIKDSDNCIWFNSDEICKMLDSDNSRRSSSSSSSSKLLLKHINPYNKIYWWEIRVPFWHEDNEDDHHNKNCRRRNCNSCHYRRQIAVEENKSTAVWKIPNTASWAASTILIDRDGLKKLLDMSFDIDSD